MYRVITADGVTLKYTIREIMARDAVTKANIESALGFEAADKSIVDRIHNNVYANLAADCYADSIEGMDRTNKTSRGITYTWNKEKTEMRMEGTSTNESPSSFKNLFYGADPMRMLEGVKSGRSYYVYFSYTPDEPDGNMPVIRFYNVFSSGDTTFDEIPANTLTKITIHPDTTGTTLRIQTVKNTQYSGVVRDVKVLTALSNETLTEFAEDYAAEHPNDSGNMIDNTFGTSNVELIRRTDDELIIAETENNVTAYAALHAVFNGYTGKVLISVGDIIGNFTDEAPARIRVGIRYIDSVSTSTVWKKYLRAGEYITLDVDDTVQFVSMLCYTTYGSNSVKGREITFRNICAAKYSEPGMYFKNTRVFVDVEARQQIAMLWDMLTSVQSAMRIDEEDGAE